MATTLNTDLPQSQIDIFNAGVLISGKNLASVKADGSVTLGGEVNGATNKFIIFSKFAPATTPLTDGTDVTPIKMTESAVIINPQEYGNAAQTTKLGNIKTDGRVDLGAAQVIGTNMVETPNALGVIALEGATNATAALTAGVLDGLDLRGANKKLKVSNILKFPDGKYRVRMHPDQEHDVMDDYKEFTKYTTRADALGGEVGELEGFKIIVDTAVTPGTVICYGVNALGLSESRLPDSDINEGNDILKRLRNYTWYGVFEYGIVDQNAVQLITGA